VLGEMWLFDYEQKYIKQNFKYKYLPLTQFNQTIQRHGGRSEAMWSQVGISTPRYFYMENYNFGQNKYLK
jgi:hypothetical protein